VSRSLGLPLLLVALVVGGILFAMQMKSEGPTSAAVTQAETQAVIAASSANFQAADAAMGAWLADHGSYAGATLDPSYMVAVAHADATTYCLQTSAGGNVEHETGPRGTAVPGPC
jgi:hypothetical protein